VTTDKAVAGEARWPMAGAVLAAVALTVLLPDDLRLGPVWLLPVVDAVLLVLVIVGDPGRIDRRSNAVRTMSIALVAVLVLGALSGTIQLIDQLMHGGSVTRSAEALLTAGATVWSANAIAFALLYWELDGGGSAARAHGLPSHPDFAFPQQLNPELAPPGWRPLFVDYLYLAFTNSTALSPTDTMPMAAWAKLAMMVQSLVSLAILGLVVANAVNLFK
jgi:uncharacterized membrane protein